MLDDEPTAGHYATLRHLPAIVEFAAVVQCGHLTQAAERIGIPQSTLSRRIARLEAALDVALFVRRGRRLQPTRAGRAFAASVERALSELGRGLEELTREHDPDSGTVSLAFLHTLGPEVVPRILREFRTVHPQIRFQLVQVGHDVVVTRLRDGDVDLGLTSPLPDEPGLASHALHRQPLCLTVPSGHRLSSYAGIELRNATTEPFIGFKPGYGMRQISDDLCTQAGFAPRLAFEGEDVATVRGLVAAGLGVALLPVSTGPPPSGVVEVSVNAPPASRTIGMAWASDHALAPPVVAFRDFLLQRGAALLSPPAGAAAKQEAE